MTMRLYGRKRKRHQPKVPRIPPAEDAPPTPSQLSIEERALKLYVTASLSILDPEMSMESEALEYLQKCAKEVYSDTKEGKLR